MLDSIQPRNGKVQERAYQKQYRRPRRKFFSLRVKIAIVLIIILGAGFYVGSRALDLAGRVFDRGDSGSFFSQLFIAGDAELLGEEEGEVRILLMGIGGEGHDGGTLTDTMILATINLREDSPQVGLVSIPRDLNVFIPGYQYRKINSAYAFGELGGQSNGPKLAIEAVEGVVGKEIPYYAVVNFDGFKRVIDELGGIYVDVPTGFTDSRFPDLNHGYLEPLVFEQGRQKMDGERALQYVRSRHGNNNEGSDFARARRQQLVIQAVGDEITSVRTLTNFSLINRLLEAAVDNIRTNLEPQELKRLYDIGKRVETQNISSFAIDGASGLVCDQIIEETGAYVLLPCEGLAKYSQIRQAVSNQFTLGFLSKENPTIEIQNATRIEGLSNRTKTLLALQTATIETANYQGKAEFQETVIYDNTNGSKPKTLEYLRSTLKSTVAGSAYPFPTTLENPDFVIVVSNDIEEEL